MWARTEARRDLRDAWRIHDAIAPGCRCRATGLDDWAEEDGRDVVGEAFQARRHRPSERTHKRWTRRPGDRPNIPPVGITGGTDIRGDWAGPRQGRDRGLTP